MALLKRQYCLIIVREQRGKMPDVILENKIREVNQPKVLNAFNTITDTYITIKVSGSSENEFDGQWDFGIQEKQPTETNKQFGERVLRELGKAIVHMVDKAEDRVRYRAEVAAIEPPASDVPDDILS